MQSFIESLQRNTTCKRSAAYIGVVGITVVKKKYRHCLGIIEGLAIPTYSAVIVRVNKDALRCKIHLYCNQISVINFRVNLQTEINVTILLKLVVQYTGYERIVLSTFKIAALYIPNHDHLFRLCNNSLCEITFWTADGEPVCRIYVTEVATRTILS